MNSLEKNNVSSYNQLKGTPSCFVLNPESNGLRVLFIGNSITLHGVAEHIGWNHISGMAASSDENDYVHICMKAITDRYPQATFAIAQLADWEREYINGSARLNDYSVCREFNADIIIVRIIENCPYEDFSHEDFKREYKAMLEYFNPSGNAKIILTEGFWHHPGDVSIKSVGEELGLPVVSLGDLGDDEHMKAIGEYEHVGVAQHPNDNGMANIAERIITALKNEEIL